MPTFTPPEVDGNLVGDPRDKRWKLHRFYGSWTQGATVWKDALGVYHQSDQPYLGGATHTTIDWDTTSTTSPDEGLATATKVWDGGHVHDVSAIEAFELAAAGYGDRINIADVDLTWEPGEESRINTHWIMSASSDVAESPRVRDSSFTNRLTSGTVGTSANLREFYLVDGTEGWADAEVYCDGINPPAFGVDAGGPGVNILPQMGTVLRAQFTGGKRRGVTLNNNIFLGVPFLNIGVWQANDDGSAFEHRETSWPLFESEPLPYGWKARLVGNQITVSIFRMGHAPRPDDPTKTKTFDLDTIGDTVGIPTPTGVGQCGFISAHAGTSPLSLIRIGHTLFRRIT